MVKYIQNLLLYWRFRRALKKCAKTNIREKFNKSIVANICGRPYIVNRKYYRKLRLKGLFNQSLKWAEVKEKQVTDKTLQQWIS